MYSLDLFSDSNNLGKNEQDSKEINFSDFDESEILQINMGLKEGLDISAYARKELDYQQMEQIRLGLKDCLDVACYSNPKFNYMQMEEIRLGLLSGIDVSPYIIHLLI